MIKAFNTTTLGELGQLPAEEKQGACHAFETGNILFFPVLSLDLNPNEQALLEPRILSPRRKNISFNPKTQELRGVIESDTSVAPRLLQFMQRFVDYSTQLVNALLPNYSPHIKLGRTSLRPVEIFTRKPLSPHKDDRLLHVDAFPSSPVQDKRIIRLFMNINLEGTPRVWRLGEAFEKVMARFCDDLSVSPKFWRKLQHGLGVTRDYRTAYDCLMLQLHHRMKRDSAYQAQLKETFDFPAQSTWMVFTDYVSHAAISGQHLLEQTFYLPVDAMADPSLSPLRQLEKKLTRDLT